MRETPDPEVRSRADLWSALIMPMFLLASVVSVEAAEVAKAIPTAFQGHWSSDLKHCDTDHQFNLEIFSDHVSFWESDGPAVSIVTKEKNEMALVLELSGESSEWLSFIHFKLSSDNSQLLDITDPYDKDQLVRYRCESK